MSLAEISKNITSATPRIGSVPSGFGEALGIEPSLKARCSSQMHSDLFRLRHPDLPGNSMSPPSMESAAFENSITSREAMPNAIETRSEFRYRNRGGCAAKKWRGSAGRAGASGPAASRDHARKTRLLKIRSHPARPCQTPSKLVPSSATDSRRLRRKKWRGSAGRAGASGPAASRDHARKTRLLKIRPQPARSRKPPSKLVPSSATGIEAAAPQKMARQRR
jgi:hypothetical protein